MPDRVPLPSGYGPWLEDRKARIHAAQQQAARSVTWELVLLDWQIGRGILERHHHASAWSSAALHGHGLPCP